MKNILVVEDDPTYLHLWGRLFKDMGFKKVLLASSPKEGLKILKEKKIDFLISDVVMKDMSGYELAKLARKILPTITILLTTGYQTDLSRYDLVGLKCHLLHKPYHNLTDVCILLERLLSGEDVFADMDEDSFSENIDNPEITEWTL
ncbi:MAG: response regulator [Deltaproteobacteria bacterium]|nr:response regulator [Deltaproteobacteria bacterium]